MINNFLLEPGHFVYCVMRLIQVSCFSWLFFFFKKPCSSREGCSIASLLPGVGRSPGSPLNTHDTGCVGLFISAGQVQDFQLHTGPLQIPNEVGCFTGIVRQQNSQFLLILYWNSSSKEQEGPATAGLVWISGLPTWLPAHCKEWVSLLPHRSDGASSLCSDATTLVSWESGETGSLGPSLSSWSAELQFFCGVWLDFSSYCLKVFCLDTLTLSWSLG